MPIDEWSGLRSGLGGSKPTTAYRRAPAAGNAYNPNPAHPPLIENSMFLPLRNNDGKTV
jgi:hypothetical protein